MRTLQPRPIALAALLITTAAALTACNRNQDRSYADNSTRSTERSSDTNHLSPTFGHGGDGGESYN